jgi:hypothetical protein
VDKLDQVWGKGWIEDIMKATTLDYVFMVLKADKGLHNGLPGCVGIILVATTLRSTRMMGFAGGEEL